MDNVAVTISFLFLIFLFLHWGWNRKSPAINWPFIGHLPGLIFNMSRLHDYMTEILKHSNGTILCRGPWFTNTDFMLTCDPANLHHILSKNVNNYPKGEEFKKVFEALGDGIFNADSESWRIQRKILHSIIHSNKFEVYAERVIRQKVEKGLFVILDHVCEHGKEIDFQNLFSHFTFDNSCLMILGVDPGCLSVDLREVPFEKAFDLIEEAAFYRNLFPQRLWKLQRWLRVGLEKERFKALDIIDHSIYHYIKLRKEDLSKNKLEEDQFDILTAFTADEEHVSAFENPEKFLRDTAFNLLSAGRDTVGSGLTWFFWHVARIPSVENKILQEMKSNLEMKEGEKWRFPSREELDKLVYLHGAICESMRLYPPVPFNRKLAEESEVLPSGHRVKAKTKMVLAFYAVGRVGEVWGEDCMEFRPERWISEKGGVIHVPSYKFPAFNAGTRSCLGKDLSFVLMKIVATSILWNYKIECVKGQHHASPQNSVVLHMKNGLKVRLMKRHV